MRGVIGRRDVLDQMGLIWREFGAGVALRCICALLLDERKTFLEIAFGR